MAANYTKVPIGFIGFILFFFVLLQPSSAKSDVKVSVSPLRQIVRSRRQVCLDGTYKHEEKTCCLCAAGQYLKAHCSSRPDDRICEQCQSGTYNSDPNDFETCRPCTSCSHPNANVEVAEPCTIARDTKCRCKEGHYCSSNTRSCIICHPCKVCSTSIKEPCTATNDTVCKEPAGTPTTAIAVSVGLLAAVAVAVAVACFLWRRKKAAKQQAPSQPPANGNPADEEILPLIDINPFLPKIAEHIGWKDVERLAIEGGIGSTAIESCKQDHPNDSEEQTLQLLKKWVETQGRNAANNLVQSLRESRKNAKADKIKDILCRGNPTG